MTLAADFFRLFSGLDRAYGTYRIPDKAVEPGAKVEGRAVTEHKDVTEQLWEAHLSGKQGIGIVPIRDDGTVSWAAIDIDVYDGLNHDALNDKLHALDIPMIVCRTKSGGAHLYIFFKQPIQAGVVRNKLQDWCLALGYPGVEVFPKQSMLAGKKDTGNWINMPYFNGDDGPRYAIYDKKKLSVERFVQLADKLAVSAQQFTEFEIQAEGEAFADGPPCLQMLAVTGFPQGSRNAGLFNIGVYTRLKFGDDWEEPLERFNAQTMQPPLASSEVQTTVKSLRRKSYFYTCNKPPIAQCCNKELCVKREFGVGQSQESTPPLLLGTLTKLNSNPPIFFIDVEGIRIECQAEELLNQLRFRRICLERANKLPPMVKQADWDKMIRARLENMEILEAPDDASPLGQLTEHMHAFLVRADARSRDEIILGKPFWDEADRMVYFRSVDLVKYLDQMHFREFQAQKLWAALRDMGGQHKQFNMKGKCVQTWLIPFFDRQTETHDPHDVADMNM